jgi:hypothetical protein
MWDAVRLDASRYDRDLEVHSMTRPALNQLILAIENGLTLRDGEVGLDALDGACQGAIDFARQQEIRIFFSDGTLKFVAGSESGESIKTRKGIFRMFCARLAVLGAGEQDLPPLYGGPLRFPGVTGTLVNTPGQQAVTLYPIR